MGVHVLGQGSSQGQVPERGYAWQGLEGVRGLPWSLNVCEVPGIQIALNNGGYNDDSHSSDACSLMNVNRCDGYVADEAQVSRLASGRVFNSSPVDVEAWPQQASHPHLQLLSYCRVTRPLPPAKKCCWADFPYRPQTSSSQSVARAAAAPAALGMC